MGRPPPSSDASAARLSGQRPRDTGVELAVRRRLHARGLRYRLHRQVVPGTRRTVDIVFARSRVAVDVRGCFWHACPHHATWPRSNESWWKEKLERNAARDRDTEARLKAAGWLCIVIWEHDDLESAAVRVEKVVRARQTKL